MASKLPATIPAATRQVLDDIAAQFNVPDARLQDISEHFINLFALGLKMPGHPMAMIPTHVTRLPSGREQGAFITLDFGGDHIRICYVKLDGKNKSTEEGEEYEVPKPLKTGSSDALFGFLADRIKEFLESQGLLNQSFQLGLNFGFPVLKTALDKGTILSWSKGFNVKNAVGKDVLRLLQDALDRKGLSVKCMAIVNDTTATLLAKTYAHRDTCFLGAIFGWGTNGAYVEDISNISKLPGSAQYPPGTKMLVNTEWCAFDNERRVLPLTSFDVQQDEASINPGFQAFEKLTSEMNLGELTQRVIYYLVNHSPPLLTIDKSSPICNEAGSFTTQYMAMIEGARSLKEIEELLVDQIGIVNSNTVSEQDATILKWVCQLVSTRSARLCGAAVAAVIVQAGLGRLGGTSENTTNSKLLMAAQGNLIRLYPEFETHLRQSVAAVVGKDVEKRLEISVVKDGNAIGAALGAWEAANS